MLFSFDASPLELLASVAREGGDAHEGEEEVKENVFHEAEDDCPQHVGAADFKLLGINALEKGGDGQNCSVGGIQEVESDHERDAQIAHDGRQHGDEQSEYFNKRGQQFVHQIVEVGNGTDEPVARFHEYVPVFYEALEESQMPSAALSGQIAQGAGRLAPAYRVWFVADAVRNIVAAAEGVELHDQFHVFPHVETVVRLQRKHT